jgi:hypothetical protein
VRARDLFIGAYLALIVALPIRWYLSPSADERFAWRMFSSRRLVKCQYRVSADDEPVDVTRLLGAGPFTEDLLPRGEPDVVVGLLRWWCARSQARVVRYASSCQSTDGEALAPLRAKLVCSTGALERENLP